MSVLACDVGGTRIKLGIVREGIVLALDVLPAAMVETFPRLLGAIENSFADLSRRSGVAHSDVSGVGFAYPSLIPPRTTRITGTFGKFDDAAGFDLGPWAQQTLGLPLIVDNDARAALIGEWRAGAGRGSDDLVLLSLGTGIGTAAIIEGNILRGTHGQAGCLGGHLVVRPGGRPCSCGNIGCAEAEASTAVLPELARQRPDFSKSALSREAVLDYSAVFAHAQQGDPCALGLREHSIGTWSALAVSLVHAYDPEMLILGGGILRTPEPMLSNIRAYVERHAHTPWGRVKVVPSTLGDTAALIGCEWLVRNNLPCSSE